MKAVVVAVADVVLVLSVLGLVVWLVSYVLGEDITLKDSPADYVVIVVLLAAVLVKLVQVFTSWL